MNPFTAMVMGRHLDMSQRIPYDTVILRRAVAMYDDEDSAVAYLSDLDVP